MLEPASRNDAARLVRAIPGSDSLARQRSPQRGADVAHVKSTGAERKNTPGDRDPAKQVSTPQIAGDQKGNARNDPKGASAFAVQESRESGTVEVFLPAHRRASGGRLVQAALPKRYPVPAPASPMTTAMAEAKPPCNATLNASTGAPTRSPVSHAERGRAALTTRLARKMEPAVMPVSSQVGRESMKPIAHPMARLSAAVSQPILGTRDASTGDRLSGPISG